MIEGGNMIKKLKIEITEKDKKIEDCKTQMKKSVTAVSLFIFLIFYLNSFFNFGACNVS